MNRQFSMYKDSLASQRVSPWHKALKTLKRILRNFFILQVKKPSCDLLWSHSWLLVEVKLKNILQLLVQLGGCWEERVERDLQRTLNGWLRLFSFLTTQMFSISTLKWIKIITFSKIAIIKLVASNSGNMTKKSQKLMQSTLHFSKIFS